MFSTRVREFMSKQDRITILPGFTKLLLKKVSICLLMVFTVLSSFAFSEPASAASSTVSINAASTPTFNSNGFTTPQCASEGGPCTFTGTKVVRYGANGSYIYKIFTNGANCDNAAFGRDPASGRTKSCYYRDVQFDDGITANASGRNKAVTVSFNVYSTQAGNLTVLKNNIRVQKTGDTAFTALGANDSVALSNTGTSSTLMINFNTALVGTANAITIAPGALMDQNGNPFDMGIEIYNITAQDLTPITYVGSSSSYGNNVTLNFSKPVTIYNDATVTAATYLKNRMSIATDGVNFVPLSKLIDVFAPGEGAGSTQIRLNANNDAKVILGTNTLIKIAGGTLKDAAGDLNPEMILHVTPPVIQSAAISNDYKKVTISFQEGVVDNTYSDGESNLGSNITLLRYGANDSNQIDLTSVGKASIDSGNLIIDFDTPLYGANNQIVIKSNALKDSYGNVLGNETITPLIQGSSATGDTSPLQYVNSYLSNGYQDLTLVFNKDVLNAQIDDASFRAGTQYYGGSDTNWNWVNIPSTATVTFSGKTVIIHFAAPMKAENQYSFEFSTGLFKDTFNNIYNSRISMGWSNLGQKISFQYGDISYDGRLLSMYFNRDIADLTIVNGVSSLKDQITISTDNGKSFTQLSSQDVLTIQGNNMVIFFQNAKQSGTIEVKIPANVISDLGNNVKNEAINQVLAYNTPTIKGFFLSNTASEFVFEDNAMWRSKVRAIRISDDNNEVGRPLKSSEYTLSAGMLTINKGVFQEEAYYYIAIDADGYSSSKEFGGRTYVSTELFYMTAPVVTTDNGITAKVNILNNFGNNGNSAGTQAVVFELMNGTTPVSIVASNSSINTGSYSANFNVADAATNSNYTVRAFVVNRFNNDIANAGLNLASIKTQAELDLISAMNGNDD